MKPIVVKSKMQVALEALEAAVHESETELSLNFYKNSEGWFCEMQIGELTNYVKESDRFTRTVAEGFECMTAEFDKRQTRLSDLRRVLPLMLLFVLFFVGCGLPEKGEAALEQQIVVSDGMARSIETGVEVLDANGDVAGHRRVTYDELVHYVYALRFGYYALEYAAGMSDVAPDPEALGPPGGWVVAPVTSGGR